MIRLFKNLKLKDWLLFLIAVLFIVSQVYLDLKMPDYMSKITTLVQTEGSEMKDILLNGGYMLLCAFGSLVAAVLVGFLMARVSSDFSLNTRSRLYRKVESLSSGDIKKFSTSSLITRTTNDITQLEMVLGMGLQLLIKAPIMAIWAINKIVNKNFEFSIITGIAVVLLLVTIITITLIVFPKFKIVQKLTDKINSVTRENLTGIRVVRAFNAEKFQEEKFAKVNNDLTNLQLFNQKTFSIMMPVMYFIMHMLPLAIYFVGATLINNSIMYDKIMIFSDMVVFTSYATQVIMSFLMLAMIFVMMPRATVSAKRINEVLDTNVGVKGGSLIQYKDKNGDEISVEFKNVSFKYPDAEEEVLKDISFKVNKGETIAFIGSTGSGKSTLVNLILRFYDVTKGEILINGKNIKDYNLNYLYSKFGYVPQKAVLFSGNVKDNIALADKVQNMEMIKTGAKVSEAEEFILKMDKNYDTHIAQGGTNISGGQKQRLAIARAVYKHPDIYVFDDSFSALDYKTDQLVRSNLKKITKNACTLIVASRIGTILHADKIVVLDEGKCVGIGTHQELMKTCEVYKQIALSQLSRKELQNA
jgi:ATP-binding cassette, subfamily B, multidrug efflux pump